VDVVIDGVGGETFEKAVGITGPGGRVVFYGATAGAARNVDFSRVFWHQISLLGSTMGTAREFAAMLQLYETRGMRPAVDTVFPLAEAAAHRRLEAAQQFGKIVLRID
jgi:NADPH:quinone reductase-like Zn-dependent oxidoreductase